MKPLLDVRNVSYSYHTLSGETKALDGLSFQVDFNEFLGIIGPSGCGKVNNSLSDFRINLTGIRRDQSSRRIMQGPLHAHWLYAAKRPSSGMADHL